MGWFAERVKRQMLWSAVAFCTTMGVFVVVASGEAPDDSSPPPERLLVPAGAQKGDFGYAYWIWRYEGGECVNSGIPSLAPTRFRQRPLRVNRLHPKARIAFHKPTRPRRIDVHAWTNVDRQGHPQGRGRVLRYRLVRRGPERWVLRLPRLRVRRHLYMTVYAAWPDTEGCGGMQYAVWQHHLARRR